MRRQPICSASSFIFSNGTPAQNTAPMIEPALTPVTQSIGMPLLRQHIQHADVRRAARDAAAQSQTDALVVGNIHFYLPVIVSSTR